MKVVDLVVVEVVALVEIWVEVVRHQEAMGSDQVLLQEVMAL